MKHSVLGAYRILSACLTLGFLPPLLAAWSSAANAQSGTVEGDTVESRQVTNRHRPEYDPIGIRTGSIFWYPQIGVAEQYSDNIFATQNNTESDFITVVSPALQMRSDWGRHAIRAAVRADFGMYASNSNEDYQDVTATAGGRLDVTTGSNLSGDFAVARLHEERSSPDDVRGAEPTTYVKVGGNAAYSHTFNRLTGRFELRADHLSYSDVPTATGGTIRNDDRDRVESEGALRLSYDLIPGYTGFVRGAYRRIDYDQSFDRNGFDRTAHGYKVDAGAAMDIRGLIALEAHVGYLMTDFDDSRLSTVDGLSAGLRAIWNVTELTTIKAGLDRDIHVTTLNGASASFDTVARVTVDHELLRNLIVSGLVGYTRQSFEGITRRDDIYNIGLSGRYLITNGLALNLSYRHDERSSNVTGADYTENLVMLRVVYGL